MKTVVPVLFLVLTVGACATGPRMKLAKAGEGDPVASQDWKQCEYEATAAVASVYPAVDKAYAKWDVQKACMAARGWDWVPVS